jgi:hypothetical protein
MQWYGAYGDWDILAQALVRGVKERYRLGRRQRLGAGGGVEQAIA